MSTKKTTIEGHLPKFQKKGNNQESGVAYALFSVGVKDNQWAKIKTDGKLAVVASKLIDAKAKDIEAKKTHPVKVIKLTGTMGTYNDKPQLENITELVTTQPIMEEGVIKSATKGKTSNKGTEVVNLQVESKSDDKTKTNYVTVYPETARNAGVKFEEGENIAFKGNLDTTHKADDARVFQNTTAYDVAPNMAKLEEALDANKAAKAEAKTEAAPKADKKEAKKKTADKSASKAAPKAKTIKPKKGVKM